MELAWNLLINGNQIYVDIKVLVSCGDSDWVASHAMANQYKEICISNYIWVIIVSEVMSHLLLCMNRSDVMIMS